MNARKVRRRPSVAGVAWWLPIPLAAVVLSIPCASRAAGLAYNENFTVVAPDRSLAEAVLLKASEFRKRTAEDWLGKELPPSVGRTIINVVLSDTEDRGFTWPIDNPKRTFHKIWLTTTRERATGGTLRHEIAHVVLCTRFPQGLPAWTAEGLAGHGDNQQRIDTRNQIIHWYARTGNWPDLRTILEAQVIGADDRAAYSVAASLTEFFLSRGDAAKLLRFAVDGKENGWDAALGRHYAVRTVDDLRPAWQAWARETANTRKRTDHPELTRLSARVSGTALGRP